MVVPMKEKILVLESKSVSDLAAKLSAMYPGNDINETITRAYTLWHNHRVYANQARVYLEDKKIADAKAAAAQKVADSTVMIPARVHHKCDPTTTSAFDDTAIFVKIHNDLRELIEIQKETLDLFKKLQGEKK